jgi:hypothetical protein
MSFRSAGLDLAETIVAPDSSVQRRAVDTADGLRDGDLLAADQTPDTLARGIGFAAIISLPFWALLAFGLYLLI